MPPSVPAEVLRAALAHAKRLATHHPGVVGVDFGLLFEGPERRIRGDGIRFHVRHKRHPSLVPLAEELPKEILGIRCDVLQVTYQPHATPRDPHDPIRPGISVGHRQFGSAGTLGCFVRERRFGSPCLLSNWHVLHGALTAQVGDPVVQPALPDLRTGAVRTVATLLDTLFFSHNLDAAIARLVDGIDLSTVAFGTGHVVEAVAEPEVRMKVAKSGINGVTRAVIDAVGGHYQLNYRPFGIPDPVWLPGIHLVPDPDVPFSEISLKGDSGSVWVNEQGQAVALNFGGEDGLGPTAEYALAHPLNPVFTLLDLEPL